MDFLPSACVATVAQASDLKMRGARRPKRRGKKRAAKARKRKNGKKRKARKLKFGSPAWRKKYMKK